MHVLNAVHTILCVQETTARTIYNTFHFLQCSENQGKGLIKVWDFKGIRPSHNLFRTWETDGPSEHIGKHNVRHMPAFLGWLESTFTNLKTGNLLVDAVTVKLYLGEVSFLLSFQSFLETFNFNLKNIGRLSILPSDFSHKAFALHLRPYSRVAKPIKKTNKELM